LLLNLAKNDDKDKFRQALAYLASSDKRNDPNWIDLSSVPAPKNGEPEKIKVKGNGYTIAISIKLGPFGSNIPLLLAIVKRKLLLVIETEYRYRLT